MDTQAIDLRAMLGRLERLERQNRIWRKGTFALLIVAATAALISANSDPSPQDLVSAKRFQLKDDAGRVRADIFMSSMSQPAFVLYDEQGKGRACTQITNEGSEFVLLDVQGKERATFQIANDLPQTVYLRKDGTGKWLARMGVDDKGGLLGVWNTANQPRFAVNETGTVARQILQLNDENDRPRIQLIKELASNIPQLKVLDANGAVRIQLGIYERGERGDGGGACTFLDADGKRNLLQVGSSDGKGGHVNGWNQNGEVTFFLSPFGKGGTIWEGRK
jgi:hypothetical protein